MDKKFIIVGRSSCPFCSMALNLLDAHELKYTFLNYENKREFLEEYKVFYNQKTVPIIIGNDLASGRCEKIGGYTDLVDFLDET